MEPAVASERPREIDRAVSLLERRRVCVLTGAGISTESGIPDYRGPERRGRPANPMTYSEFTRNPRSRSRYWARSAIGWPWIASKEPNDGHRAVAAMESHGLTTSVITQNVDGLHAAAGSRSVIELHGNLSRVVCLTCKRGESRASVQERILVMNPALMGSVGEVAPDGDVHLPEETSDGFSVPACLHCGGILKPDVVFFGESVPAQRVADAFAALERADALLVLGSSLTVYSGYRFPDRAVKKGIPVVVLNDGPTRADEIVTAKVDCRLGAALPGFVEELISRSG